MAAALVVVLTRAPELGASTRAGIQKGISYATWEAGRYAHPDADLSLARLASTGANWIALVVTGYQDSITSTAVYTTTATPTDADLIHAITQAHNLGLKVMLKPHVDIQGVGAPWRGLIGQGFTEADWAAWFVSYRGFIERYARLAQAAGVDQFAVGTELSGTTARASDWRTVVAAVRAAYGGPLTYAATWGEEPKSITWWDAVDYIGVDAYYPLTDKDAPSLDELKAGWAGPVSDLAGLASRWQRPVLLTEIGYRSLDGANRHPWDFSIGGQVDLQEQADAFEAAFASMYGQPWLSGIFWWVWEVDPFQGGVCDGGYSPHDKPAEDVLRRWYGGAPRPAPTAAPQPDYGRTLDIYRDGLGDGWEDWSWSSTRDFGATDQVYAGTRSISVALEPWGALSLRHPSFRTSPYHWLEFWVRGSAAGEPKLWAFVHGEDGTELRKRPVDECRYVDGGTITAGAWKRARIPLSDLDAAGRSVTRVTVQDRTGQGAGRFWIDDVRLVGATWRTYLPMVQR